MFDVKKEYPEAPLHRAEFEHDNCGIGACVNIKGIKSRETVENALKIVENLEHRAGKDAEGKTGDGVGILTQIPHKFFKKVTKPLGISLGEEREYGVGMFFFPQEELRKNQAKKMFEIIVEKEGLKFLGWREVPTVPSVLGHKAVECMPYIMQAFIKKPAGVEKGVAFDRLLYVARRVFEQSSDDTYVVSLSSRTIVYKGMFLVGQLRTFFADLQDKDYESAIAMVHSRFSTNTNPSWERAHPNRFIVHNGEINTIRGNADKMLAREENMESEHLKGLLHKVLPVVNTAGSDSAMLDNTLEFLVMSGMDLPLAVMITIPEPWANNKTMSQHKKDFYQYYATMMEPWDGPESILFCDGDIMGAVLDMKAKVPGTNSYGELEQVVSFRIFNASQNAPSGLTARNVTVDGKSNGAINGITAGMEYRKDGENTYTALTPEMISNGKITGIAEGTYYVRYAAKTNYDAGTDTQITVGCDVRLKMSVPAFAEVTQGYAQPQAQSLILTAEGIADAQIVSIVSSKPAEFEIIGSDTTVTAGGTLTTYTVRPMAGLPAGTHSATITVTYNTGITTESATVTGTVSMVVKAKTSGGSQDSNQGEEQPTQETVTASPAQTEEKKPVATATSEPMSSGQENGEGTSNDSEKGNVKENQNPEEEVLPVPTSEPTADDENIQQDWGNIIVVIESPEEAELKLTAELPSKTQVINACLSEEEKKAVERGENIEIRLTIKRIEKEVPVQDKELVEEQVQELASQIDGLTIGKYLDIKLDKRFNGGEWIGISEAAEDIDIIIDIPPELQFPDTQYYISRVHQGKAQLLYDLDEDEKTITISTKYFSTYALLYEAKEPASESICYWHFAILAALLIYLILALLIRDKKRGKCRIWLLGLDGALAIVFAILGSCSLDWPFAIGNIVIATCLTPNLLLKCKKEQEDEKQETE